MRMFDCIVVGAGHAGIEAALAAARLGVRTAVVTSNINRIGYMSCNPSIGGLAKGHMVRELDVLGGEMGRVADRTCIQFKRLNARKGPAVRGTRVQCDKSLYSKEMTEVVSSTPNIELIDGEATELLLEGGNCTGIKLKDGSEVKGKKVVITTGTFLNAIIHLGDSQTSGGRLGDKASVGISDQLASLGVTVGRLKTGTPPRLFKDSIRWDALEPQWGDSKISPFSFRHRGGGLFLPQMACFLGHTNEQTHEIIRFNLMKSPMYCGTIKGRGPRYCPSLEDKVTRFGDKERHQTFLEPEGLQSDLIYLQGMSTSLPKEIQIEFVRSIVGLEKAEIAQFGYAVEYDFVDPTQLKITLECKGIPNLYLAGQVNGTSGYEEAAAQGFVAGANAALSVKMRDPLVLKRTESYVGVLIDDLVTKGTEEPYRMFTSRAEHRLVLREDNTVSRLVEKSQSLGILNNHEIDEVVSIHQKMSSLTTQLSSHVITPTQAIQEWLRSLGSKGLLKPVSLAELLRRPEINIDDLFEAGFVERQDEDVAEAAEIAVKYKGYIDREEENVRIQERYAERAIPSDLDYGLLKGLSKEEREKLERIRPNNLGQASRISGVNPSAVQALMIKIRSMSNVREI